MTTKVSSTELRIQGLPTNYLECRTLGHAWSIRWWGSLDELPIELIPEVARVFRWERVRVSVCSRCDTIRDEFYPKLDDREDPDSYRTQQRRYRYGSEYQLKGVGEPPSRALFTRTAYARWKKGDPSFH